jgi:predicted MFS family arabinose efflux permease
MCMMMQLAATNTLVQTLVEDRMLGRVISLYAVAFFGGAPVGALLEGALAAAIGALPTFGVAGALCFAAAVAFTWKLPALRASSQPLYARLGLPAE